MTLGDRHAPDPGISLIFIYFLAFATIFHRRKGLIHILSCLASCSTFSASFGWSKDQQTTLTREVTGRIALTNYDPAQLSNEERRRLEGEARRYPRDHILVDIRPDFPGGEFPWHGLIEFPSFDEIVIFLANGIVDELKFDVEPDPRTPPIPYNPSRTSCKFGGVEASCMTMP